MDVAGHELPAEIASAIKSGTWPKHVDLARLRQLFGEDPDSNAQFYDPSGMQGMTSEWQVETDPVYLGRAMPLDPKRSILIGDLGVDRPVAVDLSATPYAVRFLSHDWEWRVVPTSLDAFVKAISNQ